MPGEKTIISIEYNKVGEQHVQRNVRPPLRIHNLDAGTLAGAQENSRDSLRFRNALDKLIHDKNT